jgi:hypothetical protein
MRTCKYLAWGPAGGTLPGPPARSPFGPMFQNGPRSDKCAPGRCARGWFQLAVRVLIGSMLGVLSLTAAPQTNVTQAQETSSPSAANVSAWLQYISAQLRILQAEVVGCRLEIMEATLPALETELHETQSEQQRVEEERRLQAAEAAQIDTQLTQQDLTRDERQELEARRAAFLATGSRTSQSAQSSFAQREAQARQRIAQHQERMKLLLESARELRPGGSNTSNSAVTSESRQR